ncbi:MAG: peptide chain release factor 2 [Thermomicrobiales bacterium]|nr:peptide chain release factor 2 [Thermomicrobiales bacterium]
MLATRERTAVEQTTPDILSGIKLRLDEIGVRLDLPEKRREIGELEAQSVEPGFWDDAGRAQRLMQRLTGIRSQVDDWERMSRQVSDLLELSELAEDDESMLAEIREQTAELGQQLDQMEIQLLLSGEHDESNALLAIHAGTGGIDAQDWAEMLSRMYLRWSDKRGFSTSVLDWTEGEEAGIKSTTIEIRGRYAYGLLKGEAGTHRLVRLSPFDSAHRRHTAFALVEVLPDVDDDTEVVIRDEDIRIDTYRSSGAGGQHVNKTSSAIRITHFPTGIVVTCQDERSQLQNKESAFKILRSRLVELKIREQEAERARLKGEHVTEGWGNRIRSYVLQPYTMVNDHRTDFSTSDVQGVLDGDLDPAIESYLHQQLQEQSEQVRAD